MSEYEAGKWAFLAGQTMGRMSRLKVDIEGVIGNACLEPFEIFQKIHLLLRQNEQGIQEDFERSRTW